MQQESIQSESSRMYFYLVFIFTLSALFAGLPERELGGVA